MKKQIIPILMKTGEETGFSMIEVLIAALVIFFFLIGSLQAIVLATVLRVQAQTKADAMNLINQEADAIKYQGYILSRTEGSVPPYPTTGTNCTNASYGTALQTAISSSYPASGTVSGYGTLLNGATIARNYTPNGNTLRIVWTITKDSKTVGTMTTEVLPDAALYCE